MTPQALGEVTLRRIQVLELRQRLERISVVAFDTVCAPAETGVQDRIRKRLLFLLAGHCTEDELSNSYRLLQLGRQVYERSSEVMHGGVSMVNVAQAVVDEWQAIVEQLEALHEAAKLDRGPVEN